MLLSVTQIATGQYLTLTAEAGETFTPDAGPAVYLDNFSGTTLNMPIVTVTSTQVVCTAPSNANSIRGNCQVSYGDSLWGSAWYPIVVLATPSMTSLSIGPTAGDKPLTVTAQFVAHGSVPGQAWQLKWDGVYGGDPAETDGTFTDGQTFAESYTYQSAGLFGPSVSLSWPNLNGGTVHLSAQEFDQVTVNSPPTGPTLAVAAGATNARFLPVG